MKYIMIHVGKCYGTVLWHNLLRNKISVNVFILFDKRGVGFTPL